MRNQRGQTLVLFAGLLVVFLALVALVLDGGIYVWRWQSLQVNLDNACLAAGLAESAGADGYTAFVSSLQSNEVESFYYAPYELGTDGLVIRGIQWHGSGRSFLAGLQGPHSFYLAQFMGITSMDLAVRTRCTISVTSVLPIAVKEPWVVEDIGPYPILGQGAECDDCKGADYAGAVIPNIWCSDESCDDRLYFDPSTKTNSPNTEKDVLQDIIHGVVGSPLVPIGGRIPQISGVSNKFLVKAMEDAGYGPGDQIVVIVYDGSITDNSPWENLEVLYYHVAEIDHMDANTLWATFVGDPIYSLDDIELDLHVRTVPWDWLGPVLP